MIKRMTVYIGGGKGSKKNVTIKSPDCGQVTCYECGGNGWWGFGPVPETCGM